MEILRDLGAKIAERREQRIEQNKKEREEQLRRNLHKHLVHKPDPHYYSSRRLGQYELLPDTISRKILRMLGELYGWDEERKEDIKKQYDDLLVQEKTLASQPIEGSGGQVVQLKDDRIAELQELRFKRFCILQGVEYDEFRTKNNPEYRTQEDDPINLPRNQYLIIQGGYEYKDSSTTGTFNNNLNGVWYARNYYYGIALSH